MQPNVTQEERRKGNYSSLIQQIKEERILLFLKSFYTKK
jgi:hypothetical protein